MSSAQSPAHVDTALFYKNITEVGEDNHGPEVKKFLAVTGLDEGYPWCAAFVSYCLEVTNVDWPRIRSAQAQKFITRKSIKASRVLMGIETAPVGSIVVWKRGNGPYGHAAFYIAPCSCNENGDHKNCFITIEGNTTSQISTAENERNGDGVYIRYRKINPGSFLRIVSFTPPKY